MLRFETAGESHGECLVATLTGLPAGIPIVQEKVNRELWRRQQGFGRGGRMKIETDTVNSVPFPKAGASAPAKSTTAARSDGTQRARDTGAASPVRATPARLQILRRSRGYAPEPISLPFHVRQPVSEPFTAA